MRFITKEMLDLVVTQLHWELPWREGCVSSVLCPPKAVGGTVCLKILLLRTMHINYLLEERLEAHCALYRHSALGFKLL